jgi:hypothetical protein
MKTKTSSSRQKLPTKKNKVKHVKKSHMQQSSSENEEESSDAHQPRQKRSKNFEEITDNDPKGSLPEVVDIPSSEEVSVTSLHKRFQNLHKKKRIVIWRNGTMQPLHQNIP